MFKSTFIFLLRNKNSKINSIKKKLVELIDRTVYLLVFNGSERLSGDGLQGTGYRVGYTEYCKYVLATVGDWDESQRPSAHLRSGTHTVLNLSLE